MFRIVGKICVTMFVVCVTLADARIVMEIRSENGVRDRVVVGQPFVIDVVIDEVTGSVQPPVIKGLEGFNAHRNGMYMSSINGRSTTRYSYQVRIDKIGQYTIGPAVLTHQQQEFVSNTVTVAVVKDVGTGGTHSNKNSTQHETKTFLRLMVDTESVVVGQKIGCVLRFYYQDPSISLNNIGMPELPGFDIKTIGKLESGTADINGSSYHYAQWRWDMYPTKPGEFILPAYNADYELPNNNNRMFGGLFMFINNRAETKRVYSNAITIKVAPLPYYNGPVHGVGLFERMTAQIKPGIAKEGEGMVLALEIEGFGNLDDLVLPALQMPEALKYYDSNSVVYAQQNSDELPKKRFEFIVQGMKPGDWEVPEQLFTYFDTEKNMYITLRTSPLIVSIVPAAQSFKNDTVSAHKDVVIAIPDESIAPLNVIGPWYVVAERHALPWWLFFILFFIPCVYRCYPLLRAQISSISRSSLRGRRWRAFKEARKKIDYCVISGENKDLYTIFFQLFESCGKNFSDVRSCNVSESLMSEWNSFVERITHAAYAQSENNNGDELCRMAKQWIDRLEKIL